MYCPVGPGSLDPATAVALYPTRPMHPFSQSLIEMQQNFVALTQSALLQYEQKTYIRSSPIIPVINMKAMEV